MSIPTHYQKDGRMMKKGKRAPEKTEGRWRSARVGSMLRNPAYKGEWEWGKRSKKRRVGDTIPGVCPAIVSKEIFTKAGDVMSKNRLYSNRNTHRNYLLRGLIKCALCGKIYCGSYSLVGPNKSKERAYYRCNGKNKFKDLGKPMCPSPNIRADEIEAVVWEDIKSFCKNPSIVLEQLRTQQKPFDKNVGETITQVSNQINELKRQEVNLIKIAATSQEVNSLTLDSLLLENNKSQSELIAYKAVLEAQRLRVDTLEDDIIDVAERLAQLGDRIEQASFEERRRAVEELVKEILVQSQTVEGKITPVITLTYRFNEPCQEIVPPPSAVVPDHTPARADSMVIRKSHALVHRQW